MAEKKAVVLLSGGLDSATVLAIAKKEGYQIYALSFNYGQKHSFELAAAKKLADGANVLEHKIFDLNLKQFGGSALTDDIPVPLPGDEKLIGKGIPVTYVPARNTIFLSLALAWAETIDADNIFIGVNALDYSGYPDCRPEYIKAFQNMADLALKKSVEKTSPVKILTPLIKMTKAEIITLGTKLDVKYQYTHTCYNPNEQGISCARCDACLLRLKGFKEAGFKDPVIYQEVK